MAGLLNASRVGAIGLALVWAGSAQVEAQGAGHRVGRDQVVISGPDHWRNWTFPQGTLTISPAGAVQTRRLAKNTNAVLDIVDYLRFNPPPSTGGKAPGEITLADVVKAGSNIADVTKVFDGDPATYWEPAPPSGAVDLASQWWFVVDLGRLVFARELVLRFVEEGLGDPFLLFEVQISDGLRPARLQGSDNPAFKTVLRTLSRNKRQRVFRIDLRQQEPSIEAAPVRFVQVVVTGTDGLQGAQVPRAQYQTLGADRGAIQYFKRQSDGRQVAVTQQVYELLAPQRRGAIGYFRRERPRLAELEVWSQGDEIVAGILDRGGSISTSATQTLALRGFIDGDLQSFSGIFYGVEAALANPEKDLVFDLGAFYWIDTYLLAYCGFCDARFGAFPNYRVDFSDGSLAADGSLEWTTRAAKSRSTIPQGLSRDALRAFKIRFESAQFEPIKARFGRIQWTVEPIGAQLATMAEMQFYGEGFQPQVGLESDLIRLGGSRNLLSIEWDAETPPGTQVLIQTRTGGQLGEVLHYFNSYGVEVTQDQYSKLLSIFKGDIVAEEVPGADWSSWSPPYARPQGSPIASPSPREFLKIRAILLSDDPALSPMLRSIRLHFAEPVAHQLQGEIAPFQVDQLGLERPFSLYLRPSFERRDPGFDELLLTAPANMALRLVGLFGGRAADFGAAGQGSELEPVEVVPTGPDSLLLRFPKVGPDDDVEILRLDFATALFATGAVLRAALRDSDAQGGGTWQRVDPGDALEHIPGNTTTVISSFQSQSLLTDVAVQPPTFSPNGDGINDRTFFVFKVVRVGDDSPVQAAIYDLGGRRVRTIDERRPLSAGSYQIGWEGLDDSGRQVPPGLYCVRLHIDTDTAGARVEDGTVLRTVSVAY